MGTTRKPVEETTIDGDTYFAPFTDFSLTSSEDLNVLEKWITHFKQLNVDVRVKHNGEKQKILWVNKRQHLREARRFGLGLGEAA